MTLAERMKNYENVERKHLYNKMPTILRIDGCHFHSVTRFLNRPWDEVLVYCMNETAKYLCEHIQNCKLAYVQSDEISLLLVDTDNIETQPWLSNNIQKMVSVSASMASLAFSKALDAFNRDLDNSDIGEDAKKVIRAYNIDSEYTADFEKYKTIPDAYFDCRAFNIPVDEVNNYFIWRQQDATRNSILGLAQTLYSHKQIEGIKCNELQNKMLTEKNINWNNLPVFYKRGRCVIYKGKKILDGPDKIIGVNYGWLLDNNIPIFSEDRSYIEKYL